MAYSTNRRLAATVNVFSSQKPVETLCNPHRRWSRDVPFRAPEAGRGGHVMLRFAGRGGHVMLRFAGKRSSRGVRHSGMRGGGEWSQTNSQ
ncbi:hypothetical protein chiPu_0002688 [Chiloscyllium punctatum]|uniref:Uncharacterized protein n=1 Tax=Chiloscyllium punctatum TaxID=137246 RepID=A0A401S1N9_CHIPU|nr:hypothetical protein [Chiloscyllium punctatum]